MEPIGEKLVPRMDLPGLTIGTLGGSLGPPWVTLGPQTPKKQKKLSFWNLILEDFLGHVFILLRYIFEVRFRKAYGPPFS